MAQEHRRAADVDREAHDVRVSERVAGGHRGDLPPALGTDDMLAEARAPLQAIGAEPEEVRRRITPGRLARAGPAVDAGLVRNGPGVIADGDALRARERSDDEVHPVLPDQLPRLADGGVGAGVRRRDDGLDAPARDRDVHGPKGGLDAADAVSAAVREGALQGDQDADPDRFLLRRRCSRNGKRRCGRGRGE